MWTLVLWVVLVHADVRAINSVAGFSTKTACEAAGPTVAKAILESAPSDNARVHFICVGT